MATTDILLFSGSSNLPLANAIADDLSTSLAKIDIKKFADSEVSIQIKENVRGKDVFVMQSTNKPANDHIMELVLIVDALRRASARRINVVMPYYGYARQDRKVSPRVPISAKVVAKIIESMMVNRVLTMDLHSDQIQGFFDIPVDHLFAAPIFLNYFREINLENIIIVSPDSGGAERTRFYAKKLDTDFAIIDKRREKANEAEVMNIIGNVKNKNCILIDDMIDTGGSLCKAAKALKESGANSIFAATSHGVLSADAIDKVKDSVLEELIISDTIYHDPQEISKAGNKIKVLSVASLIAKAIDRIHKEQSVSSLFI